MTPPADQPMQFFAPPADEPAPYFAPPAPIPPVEQPTAFTPPPQPSVFAPPPPVDEPYSAFAPPVDEATPTPAAPGNDPFDIFGVPADAAPEPAPPAEATPFPGFAPPADTSAFDFSAPSDPHELTFEPSPIPDTPVFLEPALQAPRDVTTQEPAPQVPVPPDDNGSPVHELPVLVEPPAPDGVADLWRAASQEPLAPEPAEPVVAPQADHAVESPAEQITAPPIWDVAPGAPPAAASPFEPPVAEVPPAAAPTVPPAMPGGFDDLLSGSVVEPSPQQPPGPAWSSAEAPPAAPSPADPAPTSEPTNDAVPEERHPFGEGVERDEAVDPSDSIFGAPPASLALNPATVPTVPEYIVVEPDPHTEPDPGTAEPMVLVAPPISVTEKAGMEPTPLEQRVGKSARLFWLWFAANSSIAAVVFGAIIVALGVNLQQAIVATLAGVVVSFIPLGLGTLAGKRSGQPTMVISRATFGVVGNILPALISLFSRMFWAAALLWVLGAGAADILVGAGLTDGFSEEQLTLAVMVIGFFLAVVIAYGGYGLIVDRAAHRERHLGDRDRGFHRAHRAVRSPGHSALGSRRPLDPGGDGGGARVQLHRSGLGEQRCGCRALPARRLVRGGIHDLGDVRRRSAQLRADRVRCPARRIQPAAGHQHGGQPLRLARPAASRLVSGSARGCDGPEPGVRSRSRPLFGRVRPAVRRHPAEAVALHTARRSARRAHRRVHRADRHRLHASCSATSRRRSLFPSPPGWVSSVPKS